MARRTIANARSRVIRLRWSQIFFKCREPPAQTLRLDMFDGFACCPGETGLAIPQPVVKRGRIWKGARHSPHVTQLYLRVAELVEGVQVPLECAADLLDVA
jgi:hypothetical protein